MFPWAVANEMMTDSPIAVAMATMAKHRGLEAGGEAGEDGRGGAGAGSRGDLPHRRPFASR